MAADGTGWGGVPADRVVAVVAHLNTGRVQIGSGYLITERLILTALHCVRDKRNGQLAKSLQVTRLSNGEELPAIMLAAALDVAVLTVSGDSSWAVPIESEQPSFGRVDRSHARELRDCQAVGFPLWQFDSGVGQRSAAELHGTIRVTEDMEYGLLVVRDSTLSDVAIPDTVFHEDQPEGTPWGGLSGALVFHRGLALGVVIEHHPRQGRSALTILPADRFAAPPAGDDPNLVAVAAALGLPQADDLPFAAGAPLADLIDVLPQGQLPRVADLDPYRLGVTPSAYGNRETYGQHDEYVQRSEDARIADALRPRRLVLLVGPSKSGKSRTAFEALRNHCQWRDALLAEPIPESLDHFEGHPALSTSDPLVIWLDDLHRFLPPTGRLSQRTISRILDRSGPTVLIGTLRTEQLKLMRGTEGELTRELRMVLDNAIQIRLNSTKGEPDAQARALMAYPLLGLEPGGPFGLAEMLAGAPELLRQYRDDAATDPLLNALIQTCIDWTRCGFMRPMPQQDLLAVAQEILEENRPDLEIRADDLDAALCQARKGIAGGGQVALLHTYRLANERPRRYRRAHRQRGRSRGYEAFDYLVAADDGQVDEGARPVDDAIWHRFLNRATNSDAIYIGVAAIQRGNMPVALAATRRAAEAGDPVGQLNLGVLLAEGLDPPDLMGARVWWMRAAQAGQVDAQFNLGFMLAQRLDPPDLPGARAWYTKAAEAGYIDAQFNLGQLLAYRLDPPDLDEARTWYTKAAEAGETSAKVNLGVLLATRLDPPELAEARTWYTKAAEAGDTPAQYNLGVLLATRLDPPELAEARTWLTRASEAGETDARHVLDQIRDGAVAGSALLARTPRFGIADPDIEPPAPLSRERGRRKRPRCL